jgi:hypothetical protein
MGMPLAVNFLGDAKLAGVQLIQNVGDGIFQIRGRIGGVKLTTAFKGLFDDVLQVVHDSFSLVKKEFVYRWSGRATSSPLTIHS